MGRSSNIMKYVDSFTYNYTSNTGKRNSPERESRKFGTLKERDLSPMAQEERAAMPQTRLMMKRRNSKPFVSSTEVRAMRKSNVGMAESF